MRAADRLRDAAGAAAGTAPFAAAVGVIERLGPPAPRQLAVLMYHRIARGGESPALDPALVSATIETFAEQMTFLVERRPFVSLDLLLAVRRGEAELPTGAVMVTFDDAYTDFAHNAWPVLQPLGIPATLFVPTAYPGDPARAFWWDRLHHALRSLGRPDELRDLRRRLERMPHDEALAEVARIEAEAGVTAPAGTVLSWDELRRLRSEGVALAAHTRTHPLLHRIPLEAVREEVAGSLADLERELGTAPPALAYPGGGHSDEVARVAADAGIEVGFTARRGVNDLPAGDWLRLRRINVGRRATLPAIRVQLLGWPGRRAPGRAHAAVGAGG